MGHPYYNKAAQRKSSNVLWIIALMLLAIILGLPWILPAQTAEKQPYNTLKQICTFNLEYEWHHSTINIQKPEETSSATQSDETSTQTASDLSGGTKWFPLAVGNRWVYEHTKKGGMMNRDGKTITTKAIEVVDKIEVRRITLYQVKSTENGREQSSYYYTENDNLMITHDIKRPTRRALLVMPSSPKINDSWHESDKQSPSSTVRSFENVQTSNGPFTAMLIETRYMTSEDRNYQTYYAENVGIVMQYFGSEARGTDTWLLKDFSLN
ncbi:hypothetical protein J7L05_03260 [bacterium]|nr:hypothetical protein [bacterium]